MQIDHRCGNCANFTPLNPDDKTAPEGRCGLKEWPAPWPMSYWPAMLSNDYCLNGFKESEAVTSGNEHG